jgi:hypothetical protein
LSELVLIYKKNLFVLASHLKIFNVVPELYPRLVQVSGGNLYDGNGNLITVIGQGGGSEGAQGFQGPTGPDGTVRNDSFSASVITITHSLGYYPVVQVINSGGEVVMPLSISHSSVNSFTVDFGTAFSGYVITGAGAVGVTGPQGTNGVLGGTGPTGPQGPTGPTPSLSQVLLQGNTASNSINMSNYPITSIDYLDFYTTTTASSSPGRLYWNDTDGTLNLGLKGGNVTLQIGQEEVVRVVNKSGENLLESEYKVVRVRLTSEGGAQGQRLAVVLAQADNDPDSATTLGLVTENITDNQEGFITISGLVNGINTTATSFHGESWSDGDILYLSSSVPGGMTNVKPTSPNHTVIVGFVVYAHPNNGKIFVKIDNGYELKELHDVYYTTPSDGDILQWSGTNSRWEAKTFTGGTGSGSGTTGAQGPIGPTGLGGTIANYGYFYDTTTQTNAGATAVNPMTFNTTDLSVGVSIVSNSRMTIANSGVYNIQFSAQIEKTDPGTDVIDIWLRKNGNDVVDSNGTIEISGAGAEYIAAWNYLVQSNANDYYEIVWSSADLNIRLLATGTQSSPTRPAVPSVIASVTQVTYTQIGPTGSTGFQGSTGSQGPIGPQGNTGPQGETGPQGFQGETGPQGNQGNQGFTGPQGFQGTTGPQGSTGSSGSNGNQGFQGPTGPSGTGGGGSTSSNAGGLLYLFYNY